VLGAGEHVPSGMRRLYSEEIPKMEYAFEMASSAVRYGPGVTREVGKDLRNFGLKKVCVFTDKTVAKLPAMKAALESLHSSDINFQVFDNVSIEPSNDSLEEAIRFVRAEDFDGFLAVGGGSVMDTAKVANIFFCHREAELLDFTNAPVGKGMKIEGPLKPLIAVPTTSGTGSESSGVAIYNHKPLGAKTGISGLAMRPTLGIIDPFHARTMPKNVAAYSGFDVLCSAVESFTVIPYFDRGPCPPDPSLRPVYQGSNPLSDIWSMQTLKMITQFFKRSVLDAGDHEARSAMHLAAMCAGVGFGNAGVHLCHGLSYAISGQVQTFTAQDYDKDHPLVPHGLSVVITAPAVFKFTAPSCPERHLLAAEALGADITNAKKEDAGLILADVIKDYMYTLGIQNGISALGYKKEDIPSLVQSTLPQERVLKLSPLKAVEESISRIYEDSLIVY
jgi:hydroxyacid-oxoacid transhydrogenase